MFEATVLDTIRDERVPAGLGGRWYGVYPALVTDIQEPNHQGRVKVTLPWSPDTGGSRYEAWARLATLMGGKNRGTWFIPDTDDEVLIGFEAGDPVRPYVLGALWNGRDTPPDSMDGAGKNQRKVLRSRNGVKVTLDATEGKEALNLEPPAGQKVTLKEGRGWTETADPNANSVKRESSGTPIPASAKVTIRPPPPRSPPACSR